MGQQPPKLRLRKTSHSLREGIKKPREKASPLSFSRFETNSIRGQGRPGIVSGDEAGVTTRSGHAVDAEALAVLLGQPKANESEDRGAAASRAGAGLGARLTEGGAHPPQPELRAWVSPKFFQVNPGRKAQRPWMWGVFIGAAYRRGRSPVGTLSLPFGEAE